MVEDPVHDMIYDAITKPYHDPEFALRLLPNKVTQYIPAPESKQTLLDFNWKRLKNLIVEDKMIFNPFQVSLKPNHIFWTTIYEGTDTEVDTGETFEITGVWKTTMVGPLKGKPYSKTVPIVTRPYKLQFFYGTYDSDFYPYWFEGADKYDASLYIDKSNLRLGEKGYMKLPDGTRMTADAENPRYKLTQIINNSYGNYYQRNDPKKRQRGNAIFTKSTRLIMKEYEIEDRTYYVYNPNTVATLKSVPPNIKPVNYNPPAYTLADFFMNLSWGECLFEEPPSELDAEVRETMLSIQSNFREMMIDWVDEQVGEMFYYDTDEDGRNWDIPKDWAIDMMADFTDKEILDNFVDMVLGWHFSYLDSNDPLNVYLLAHGKDLEKFRDSGWLQYQCQINLSIKGDLDDWLTERLDDYYD